MSNELKSAKVPPPLVPLFSQAEKKVEEYFKDLNRSPTEGSVEINGERYLLVRANSMAVDLHHFLLDKYPLMDKNGAIQASFDVVYDIAFSFGKSDAKHFKEKSDTKDPIEQLAIGPLKFAHAGWSLVEIHPDSKPVKSDDFFLNYFHPQTFEAESWLKEKGKTQFCTCYMNAGYSAGWCSQSFGMTLRAFEIKCRAKGDEHCHFIMAPPHRLQDHLERIQ